MKNIIFIPGLNFKASVFKPIIEKLKYAYNIIEADHSIKTIPDNSILVGWSLGGLIATQLAVKFPDKVKKLICIAHNPQFIESDDWPGVSLDWFNEFNARQFNFLISKGVDNQRKHIRFLSLHAIPVSSTSSPSGLQQLKETNVRNLLAQVQCPITYILGDNDPLTPVAIKNKLNIKTVIIKNGSHIPFLVSPENIIDEINHKKKIAHCFNKACNSYNDAATVQKKIANELIDLIRHRQAKTILDIGAGTGFICNQLKNCLPDANIIAIDIADKLLNQIDSGVKLAKADFDFLPFRDNQFDLVVSSMALQWSDNIGVSLKEWRRVLKDDGELLFSLPVDGSFQQLINTNSLFKRSKIDKQLSQINLQYSSEKQSYRIYFKNLLSAYKHFKQTGANYIKNKSSEMNMASLLKNRTTLINFEILFYVVRATRAAVGRDIEVKPISADRCAGRPSCN